MQQDTPPRTTNRAATVISIIAALVGGWFLHGFVYLRAQNDPWGVGFLVAVCIAVAVGAYFLQERRWERGRLSGTPGKPDRSWVAPAAILGVAACVGFFSAHNAREYYVRPYCLYGARSAAQLDQCMSHVTNEDINRLDTQAARFGRGDTHACLEDAGPYCANASQWNGMTPEDQQ